jgi:hypothetical protein
VVDVEFNKGKPVFAKLPATAPGQVVTKNRRILIYAEFPSMTSVLRNVRPSLGMECTTR